MTDTAAALGFTHRFVPGTSNLTLLLLHGTGGDENDLVPLSSMLRPDAALLSPRGKQSEHGAPRFFRRIAPGVFDEKDLILRTQELATFVGAAAIQYGFDARRVYAVGFSNGANIAASLLLLHPGVLAGAVLLRATIPIMPPALPGLAGVPVLIAAGRADTMVPAVQSEKLATVLRQAGADVTLHWSDGGHGIGAEEVAAAKEWLAGR